MVCAQGNLIEEPYTDGALIIKEGEAGESMYLLKSGTASATKAGFDFEIEYMPGDFFGELALLTASPRGAVSAPSRPPTCPPSSTHFVWCRILSLALCLVPSDMGSVVACAEHHGAG